jgi:predicted Zn-dependent protease with MMP-like domain
MGLTLKRDYFEALVWQEIENLPTEIKDRLENVLVIIEDRPSPEIQAEFDDDILFGLYQGTPLKERSVFNVEPQPDLIYIFQKNIEEVCETEEEVRDEIRTTVIHEVGHYFGLDEERLDVLEKDRDDAPS